MARNLVSRRRDYGHEALADILKLLSDGIHPLNCTAPVLVDAPVSGGNALPMERLLPHVEHLSPEGLNGFMYADAGMRSLAGDGDVALVCRSSVHMYAEPPRLGTKREAAYRLAEIALRRTELVLGRVGRARGK